MEILDNTIMKTLIDNLNTINSEESPIMAVCPARSVPPRNSISVVNTITRTGRLFFAYPLLHRCLRGTKARCVSSGCPAPFMKGNGNDSRYFKIKSLPDNTRRLLSGFKADVEKFMTSMPEFLSLVGITYKLTKWI
jgi:hypothetical protein